MNKKVTITIVIFLIILSIWQISSLFTKLIPKEEYHSIDTPKVLGEKAISESFVEDNQNEQDIPFTPDRIVIEKISLDLPVLEVPLINGTWQVNERVANYALGTSQVSVLGGNVGIYGHAKSNAFKRIKDLEIGDIITVYKEDKRAAYKVSEKFIVTPETVNVFYPTETPQITLLTCDGAYSEKRYIVRGDLIYKE